MTTLQQIYDAPEDYLDCYLRILGKKPNNYTINQKRLIVVCHLEDEIFPLPPYVCTLKSMAFRIAVLYSNTYGEFKNNYYFIQ